jgi:hypothetical protein
MTTREIPRSEWLHFCDSFTNRHIGANVSLEVLSPDLGDQVEAEDVPLQGVSADKRDRDNMIEITLGKTREKRVTRAIQGTTHLRVKQDEEGTDQALEIESSDGVTTLLVFRPTILPTKREGSPEE